MYCVYDRSICIFHWMAASIDLLWYHVSKQRIAIDIAERSNRVVQALMSPKRREIRRVAELPGPLVNAMFCEHESHVRREHASWL